MSGHPSDGGLTPSDGGPRPRRDASVDAYVEPYDAGPVADPLDPDTWINEPVRPVLAPRPPWEPEFGPFGPPDSETTFCNHDTGDVSAVTLSASTRGVFVGTWIQNNHFHDDPWSGRPSGMAVHQYVDGTWQQRLWAPLAASPAVPRLFVDAADDAYLSWSFEGCTLFQLAPGPLHRASLVCYRPGLPDDEFPSVLTTSETSISSILTNHSAYTWSPSGFTPIPALSGIVEDPSWIRVYAENAEEIIFAGLQGHLRVYDKASETIESFDALTPAGDIRRVVREPGGDLLLAYGNGSVLRFDGSTFESISMDHACDASVDGFWSDGSSVYYYTSTTFGRIESDGDHPIVDMDCFNSDTYFMTMRGLGSDVYLVVQDPRSTVYQCGSIYVVRFDGEKFHDL